MKSPRLYITIFFCVTNIFYAQVETELLSDLNTIYYNTDKVLNISDYNKSSLENNQFKIPKATLKLQAYRKQDIELQQRALLNDIGLSFRATINHNLNKIFDEENNEFVTTRVRAELEWQLLKQGLFSNRNKANQLSDEAMILDLEEANEATILWRRQFRLSYTYAINKELLVLYNKRIEFLNGYFDVLTKLYSKKLIDRERIIKTSYDIEKTKQEITNYKTLNKNIRDSIFVEFETIKLPFLKIENDAFSLEAVNTEMDSLQQSILVKDYSWFEDVSLSLYANQNWVNSNITNRNYASVGLRLKIPLKRSFNKELRDNKLNILKEQQSDKSIGKYNLALTHYNSYREKLKDLKDQYKIWCVVKERKRKLHLIKSDIDSFQIGIQLADALIDQFEILKNMLQIKRQLYTSLSHLYELDNSLKLSTYIFEKSNQKRVLVSKTELFTIEHQIAFLELKQIEVVHVENIGKEFIDKLKRRGYKVIQDLQNKELIRLEDWMLYEQTQLKN